jgi:hypothetical protein
MQRPGTIGIGGSLTPRGEVWEPNYTPGSQPSPDDFAGHEPNLTGVMFVGGFFVFLGLVILSLSSSVGVGFVLFGIILMAGGHVAGREGINWGSSAEVADAWGRIEEDLWKEDSLETSNMTQQQIDEIVRAVKTTIRVRCRYCGTLNEEKANRCESCGASL